MTTSDASQEGGVMVDPATLGQRDRSQRARPLLRNMLGNALRRNRLAQGRTLADVARTARVSMPYLSELERGRKEASSEILAAVCEALRVDLSDLLAEVGRDLISGRSLRSSVVRLDSIRERRALAQPHRRDEALPDPAADLPSAADDLPATADALPEPADALRAPVRQLQPRSDEPHASANAQYLLAA